MKRLLRFLPLVSLFLMGANTDRFLTSGKVQTLWFGTSEASQADSLRVIGFKATGAGTTSVRTLAEPYRFWEFLNLSNDADTLWIHTRAFAGYLGSADTSKAGALKIIIPSVGRWQPEGLDIDGFQQNGGPTTSLLVIARK